MNAAEHASTKALPIGEHERIAAIDITCGAALLGVLLMNLETDFRMPLARAVIDFHTDPGSINHAVDWLLEIVVAGKAISAFSLLFGVGLAVQAQRARDRGRGKMVRVRRLAILYGYGLGLFGRLSSAEALPIGLTLYAAQVVGSALWLRRFRFGPAEWLWRSSTYGQWQPLSRVPSASRAFDMG